MGVWDSGVLRDPVVDLPREGIPGTDGPYVSGLRTTVSTHEVVLVDSVKILTVERVWEEDVPVLEVKVWCEGVREASVRTWVGEGV